MNYELEIYKLIMNPDEDDLDISYVDEFGWTSDTEFSVWISIMWLSDFIAKIKDIFRINAFDDGGLDATLGYDYVRINLVDIAEMYDVNLENVFPKNKYRH